GTVGSDEYVAVFTYGTGNNNVKVLKIPNGNPTAAVLYGATPTMGAVANSSGSGDVDFQFNNDLTVNIFALTTNNGLGAYRTDANIPVELTNFVANVVDRDVLLNWSTATEINNLGFEVERKASDNGSWSKLAFIKSAGTTTEPQQYSYKDSRLESGKYSYRLKIVDLDGTYSYSDVVEVEIGIPNQYALSQNYPNPFNPTTRIDYQLPFDAKVQIELYSITGEKVATLVNGDFSAGYHTYELNAYRLNLSSGVYFYRISATDFSNGKFVDTKKLVLLK
ncbi:MAG: T9SS type A sorting domain-containing protein, partial [Ignavibacterium album]|uniref:T9SS type A sorting domain-containing protein n=1 Tax=Ignavibacterium album TaxID=591197 RepID=UPI0026ED13CA